MRRSVVTLLLVLLALGVTAPPALAAAEDSWANSPLSETGASFDAGAPQTTEGDPFADDPKVTIYETYGFGFAQWRAPEVDEGWIRNPLPDFDAERGFVNAINSYGLKQLTLVLALLFVVMRLAYNPEAIALLEPMQRIGQEVFGDRIFMVFFGLTMMAAGIWLSSRATAANFRAVAVDGTWVLLMLMVGLMATLWPFAIAPKVDAVLTNVVGGINTAAAGVAGSPTTATDGATALIHDSILYETWCSGLLGRDAGEKIADEYCPRLLVASTFSYGELAETAGDTDARADLSREKYDDYQAAAEELADEAPSAYGHLTGQKPWSRFGTVALAYVAAAGVVPFALVSSVLLFYALAVFRVALMLAPGIVVIAGYPPAKRIGLKVFDYVVASLLTALVMGAGLAGFLAVIGGILAPTTDTHPMVAALVMLIITVVFFRILRPKKYLDAMRGRSKKKKGLGSPTPASSSDQETSDDPQENAPAEAERPSRVRGAASGAAGGAAGAAAGAAAAGGPVGWGVMAAGAARGAALGLVGHDARSASALTATHAAIAAHHPPVDAPSNAQTDEQPGAHRATDTTVHATPMPAPAGGGAHALPAGSGGPTVPAEDVPRAQPQPMHATVTPSRVYMPDESPDVEEPLLPPARARKEGTETVHTIYQGGKA